MLSRWQKLGIVHGFLNTQPEEVRMNWHHSIEQTYQDLKDGHHGDIQNINGHYKLTMPNGQVYLWSE